ncbi:MAG: hypothetical protein K5923_02555 [Clostridia bacterium]|nr:hypothetical protein [Clostridia bacterium]
MPGFSSVLRYTARRHNIWIGIITFAILLVIILSLFSAIKYEEADNVEKDIIIQRYKDNIQFYKDRLEVENREAMRNAMQEKIEYYSYLVDNNKVESEYYNIGGFASASVIKSEGHEGSAFMFFSYKWLSYVIYILAAMIPLLLFVTELGGPIKNIVGTSLTRDKIYNYFYLESFMCVTLMNVIVFIIGLIGGLNKKSDAVLLIQKGYREVSTLEIYCWACFGRYILSLLFVNIMTIVGIKTKSVTLSCIYFGLIVAASIVIGLFASANIFNELAYDETDPLVKLPIIGIDANQVGVTKDSIISIVYHCFIAISIYVSGLVYFRKKNI